MPSSGLHRFCVLSVKKLSLNCKQPEFPSMILHVIPAYFPQRETA